MADHVDAPGTAPVTDRRPVPRGVLPRGVQTWLMVALAIGMLFIIFLTGQPDSPAGTRAPATPAQAPLLALGLGALVWIKSRHAKTRTGKISA